MGVACSYQHPRAFGFRKTDIVDETCENVFARTLLRLDIEAREWNTTAEEHLNTSCKLLSDPYLWKSIRFTHGSFHNFLMHTVAYGRVSRTTLCKKVFLNWPFSDEKTIGDLIDLDPTTPLRLFHTEWDLFDEYGGLLANDSNIFNVDYCFLEPAVERPFVDGDEDEEPQPMELEEEESEEEEPESIPVAVEPAVVEPAPIPVVVYDSERVFINASPTPIPTEVEPVVVEPTPIPVVVENEPVFIDVSNDETTKRGADSELTVSSDFHMPAVSSLERLLQPWVESYDPKAEARFNKDIEGSIDWNKFDLAHHDTVVVNGCDIDFLFTLKDKYASRMRIIPDSTGQTDKFSPSRLVYIQCDTERKALKRALLLYTAQHEGCRHMTQDAKIERVVNAILYARGEPCDEAVISKIASDFHNVKKFKSKVARALLQKYESGDRKVRAKK